MTKREVYVAYATDVVTGNTAEVEHDTENGALSKAVEELLKTPL